MQNKLTLLLATILLTTSLSLSQTKPDKNILKFEQSLLKPEESFANGDYKAAKNALIKAKKKITAKLGAQNQFTATMLLMEAKYDLGLGMPKDFEANIQSALRASEKLNSENS